ncbi:hypothetical protein N1F78_09990 [Seonamhaeicola sp. MEBiC1930]|uniref:hypothetical protein n=1 Tax=Seonamhaeicola sp. MEBiC01930 TaxID=2976768 RepID=UPI0032526DE3
MRHSLWCIYIIAFIFSCENEPVFDNENNEVNFYALEVGNSWVYKSQRYDASTQEYRDNGVVDYVSIVGTEVIEGNTYYKFRTETIGSDFRTEESNPTGLKFEYFRELDGNLINEEGFILFTNNNYEERLVKENNWGNVYEVLVEGSTIINVEAGEFECVNSERYAILSNGTQSRGLDRYYYASGLGLIYHTFSYISSSTPPIVRRLVSYNIQ